MAERSEAMVSVAESVNMDVLLNIAARAYPDGVVIGFCPKCRKEREYDWHALARMMSKGLPRCKCSGERIDLRAK